MPDLAKDPLDADSDAIEEKAGTWVLRLQAGLSAEQEKDLFDWLAADIRHRAAFAELKRTWDRMEPLAVQASAGLAPILRLPQDTSGGVMCSRPIRFWRHALAAAAVFAFGVLAWRQHRPPQSAQPYAVSPEDFASVLTARCEQRTLDDGSVVQLNRGASIIVRYTPAVRVVELTRGEAHFKVAHNAARPFVVKAAGVEVRAVGTAFDVRFDSAAMEVLVTEGKVALGKTASGSAPAQSPMVKVGEDALISLRSPAQRPEITALTAAQMETKLAWRPRLLTYDDAPLAEIIAEFNRHNPVHLVVADPTLGSLRLTATFRSDNMEGFVRLIESNYGVRAQIQGDREIVLNRK